MTGDRARQGDRSARRPPADALLTTIADYVCDYTVSSTEAIDTARHCLLDSLGCAFRALQFPQCTRLLGPVVPGATLVNGARVPGTDFELDPVQAAFNIGTLIRWLDYNDTWLAAEWGHPSDNLGAILAVTDYLSRQRSEQGQPPCTIGEVLRAMVKAYEIQGILALENSFNQVGLDHVLLVRIASTAVAAQLFGASRTQVVNALSNAWLDGGALRAYRHAPNTGSRKSWAAGDATARAVRLALMALAGEMGYPSALTARQWGFQDVLFGGRPIVLSRPLGSYVMENILFKIAFPAEFHAQTAVEAALQLHEQVRGRLDEIAQVRLETQSAAVRIIDKTGPLANPADRDHCLQYMVAVPLIFGRLTARDYEDEVAADPRIDRLREKMVVNENPDYTRDYHDPDKRAIANAIEITFKDGQRTPRVEVYYPLGHRRRRSEGLEKLREKFVENLGALYDRPQAATILSLTADPVRFDALPVNRFLDVLVPRSAGGGGPG